MITQRGVMWLCRAKRKDISIARSFEKKIEAEIWEKQVISAIDNGTFKREDWIGEHGSIKRKRDEEKASKLAAVAAPAAREITFGDALQKYASTVTQKKKGASQEQSKINKWLRDPLANRPLNDLDSADFAAWRDERLADGTAPATIRNYLAIVSHLFNIARREWRIKLENPIGDVAKPTANNERTRRLSPEEEFWLLHAIDNPGDGAGNRRNKYIGPIVRLALETAMRQSEILSLEWQNVDLKKKTVWLPTTKNGDAATIPLSSRAIEILESVRGQHIRKVKGTCFPTTCSALKQSWSRAIERAKRNYKSDCENAGREADKDFLDDLHFHDLRHEATSRLFESGRLEMMEVASITRHKDLRMLKRYTHLRAEELAKKLG